MGVAVGDAGAAMTGRAAAKPNGAGVGPSEAARGRAPTTCGTRVARRPRPARARKEAMRARGASPARLLATSAGPAAPTAAGAALPVAVAATRPASGRNARARSPVRTSPRTRGPRREMGENRTSRAPTSGPTAWWLPPTSGERTKSSSTTSSALTWTTGLATTRSSMTWVDLATTGLGVAAATTTTMMTRVLSVVGVTATTPISSRMRAAAGRASAGSATQGTAVVVVPVARGMHRAACAILAGTRRERRFRVSSERQRERGVCAIGALRRLHGL